MNRMTLAYLFPPVTMLALAACATRLPDASTDHPANPNAAQAASTPRSTTLDYSFAMPAPPPAMDPNMKMEGMKQGEPAPPAETGSPAAMDPNMKMEGMKPSGPAPPSKTDSPTAMDPSMKMEGTKHGGATSADPHAGHNMDKMNAKSPKGAHEEHEENTQVLQLDTYYTCPMHPEVRQPGPGKCPKCGMKLVKKFPKKDTDMKPDMKMDGKPGGETPPADAPHAGHDMDAMDSKSLPNEHQGHEKGGKP